MPKQILSQCSSQFLPSLMGWKGDGCLENGEGMLKDAGQGGRKALKSMLKIVSQTHLTSSKD